MASTDWADHEPLFWRMDSGVRFIPRRNLVAFAEAWRNHHQHERTRVPRLSARRTSWPYERELWVQALTV